MTEQEFTMKRDLLRQRIAEVRAELAAMLAELEELEWSVIIDKFKKEVSDGNRDCRV